MSVYHSLMLAISFAMLVIAVLKFNQKKITVLLWTVTVIF
ncbi:putative holin-like toxin [Lactobacillus sp. YT155]